MYVVCGLCVFFVLWMWCVGSNFEKVTFLSCFFIIPLPRGVGENVQ